MKTTLVYTVIKWSCHSLSSVQVSPLPTYGEGQESLSLYKIPFGVKEVVGVELMWCLPLRLIQQH